MLMADMSVNLKMANEVVWEPIFYLMEQPMSENGFATNFTGKANLPTKAMFRRDTGSWVVLSVVTGKSWSHAITLK